MKDSLPYSLQGYLDVAEEEYIEERTASNSDEIDEQNEHDS
jgi:hypothetical protein